jgi:endonuclease YncB( thermonuclease family)
LKGFLFAIALAALFLPATTRAADKNWARLTGCTLMENPSNDGDSFHVKYNGKEFIFRLYFVDTCETSDQIPERVKEQAQQLGITESRVLEAGKAAAELTHSQLAGRPFTVVTRWQDAKGASRLPRYYAFVLYGKGDEHDLASTLAQNGMVRIYGMPAGPPGPMSANQFRASLLDLEASAKARRLGIYGNLSTAGAADTGLNAGAIGAAGHATAVSSVPLSFLFPAKTKSPYVVENPADDLLADFAVDSANAKMIIQNGVPEDNFSEIPGWKPPSKRKSSEAPDVPEEEPAEVPD